jgi:hypothetical protein
LDQSIKVEFLTVLENIPLLNVHGTDGIEVKEQDGDVYDIDNKSELKIISFEKSMYNSISKDMINFLSGIKSFNNLIGDPVNKYRKNYKLLSHLKSKYFFNVKNENQFERYVSYYRWIDKTVGIFLQQMVPAGVPSNTGIENVIESHILERNKIDYKLTNLKSKEVEIEGKVQPGPGAVLNNQVQALLGQQEDVDAAREEVDNVAGSDDNQPLP